MDRWQEKRLTYGGRRDVIWSRLSIGALLGAYGPNIALDIEGGNGI